jgi:hypothetical protein
MAIWGAKLPKGLELVARRQNQAAEISTLFRLVSGKVANRDDSSEKRERLDRDDCYLLFIEAHRSDPVRMQAAEISDKPLI